MAIDPQALVARAPRIIRHSYTRKDVILYALGIGAGQTAADIPFVYEEGLRALPTLPVVLAYPGFWQREPEFGINWKQLLHGEQSVTIHGPIPVEGAVRGEMTIEKIIDKGSTRGALLYSLREIFDESDDRHIASVRQVSFLRGDGGCGSTAEASAPAPAVPDRAPDAEMVLSIRPEQALVYRLSGDLNPLHVDPQTAREGGLERPILHGLCTYGFAGRALLALLCGGRADAVTRLDCRFTAPVFPGEDIKVSAWVVAPGEAMFKVTVPARDKVVLDNGFMTFKEA